MKTIILFFGATLLFICCDNKPKKSTITYNSYSVDNVRHDTINRSNEHGKQGYWMIFYKDSLTKNLSDKVAQSGEYVNDKKQGVWIYYKRDGYIDKKIEYKDDMPIGTSTYSAIDSKACKTKSTTIKGIYNGKNLFFQNSERNGIQKILLDKKEITTEPNSPTFELLLTDLKKGQKFELTIFYCDVTPKPYKILNEDAIK